MKDVELTTMSYANGAPVTSIGYHSYNNVAYNNDQEDPDTAAAPAKSAGPADIELEISEFADVENWDKVENDTQSSIEIDNDENCATERLQKAQSSVQEFFQKNKKIFLYVFLGVFIAGYFAYFGYAIYYEFGSEPSVRLVWVTCVVVFFISLNLLWKFCGEKIKERCRPCIEKVAPHETLISWVIAGALFLAMIIFVFVDVFVNTKQPYNLVSGSGIIVYVLLFFVFSVSPAKVQWRAVAWGIGLQFLLAIIILRSHGGYVAFEWLGEQITIFLAYSDVGAEFVFGEDYEEHFFAFKILPTVIFFSTVMSVLYYLGAMQVVIYWISMAMQFSMGTTAGESMNAAGNIFVGQTEAPLLIRPLLPDMTKSEIHAVMTGGFATIAGAVLAAYVGFGVPANHLLTASVMSAPAALAMAKLFYPETETSRTTTKDVKKMTKSKEVNFIAAASNGATSSIKLVANIAVNLIAFLALLAFVDATLSWFGQRVGLFNPPLTFELICSYILYPFAFIMGVIPDDCRRVAKLIGIKTFLNEFIAYTNLGEFIDNRVALESHVDQNGTWYYENDDIILDPLPGLNATQTLLGGVITVRSEVIATYALCGFSNIGAIGIQLGGLGALAPSRRDDLASVAVRAMIAGSVACFMTASVAGLFYQG